MTRRALLPAVLATVCLVASLGLAAGLAALVRGRGEREAEPPLHSLPDTLHRAITKPAWEILDRGFGLANVEPLWPLALGYRCEMGPDVGLVRERWPTPHGTAFLFRNENRTGGKNPHLELLQSDEGIFLVSTGTSGGRYSRPLMILPDRVREGMAWRSHGRLPVTNNVAYDSQLEETDTVDFRVLDVREASGPWGRRRLWTIEYVGPRRPAFYRSEEEHAPGRMRGINVFVEGRGPSTFPHYPLDYSEGRATASDPAGTRGEALRPLEADRRNLLQIVPLDSSPPESRHLPDLRLERLADEELAGRMVIADLSGVEAGSRPGELLLRLDGYGVRDPDAPPVAAAAPRRGTANGYRAQVRNACLAFDGHQLVDVYAQEDVDTRRELCIHAVTAMTPYDRATVVLPGTGLFGQVVSPFHGSNKTERTLRSTRPQREIYPVGLFPDPRTGAPATVAWHCNGPSVQEAGWSLFPWWGTEETPAAQVNGLEPLGAIDDLAYRFWLPVDGPAFPTMVVEPREEQLLFAFRQQGRTGVTSALSWGRIHLDSGTVEQEPGIAVQGRVSYRRLDDGRVELLEARRAGLIVRLDLTPAGIEEVPLGHVRLPEGHILLFAIRSWGDELLVFTTPGAEWVPAFTPVEWDEYLVGYAEPEEGPVHIWETTVPEPATAGTPVSPALGLTFEPVADDVYRLCWPSWAGKGQTTGWRFNDEPPKRAELVGDGRCIELEPAAASFYPHVEGPVPGIGRVAATRARARPAVPALVGLPVAPAGGD